MRSAPDPLVEASRTDPVARAVLVDWLEEHGHPHWAAWLRSDARGDARRNELARALKRSGLRLRDPRPDATRGSARDPEPRWFRLDEPFDGPFLHSLAWTVRDPALLRVLLAFPPFALATRVHLASWRPRSAIPTVLAELGSRRPGVRHLDVLDVPVPLAALAPFTGLEGLGMRLDGSGPAELSVKHLCIRTLQPADLEAWVDVRTPGLEMLEIHRVPGPLTWDPSLLAPARMAALLDRPAHTVWIDRTLFGHYRDTIDRRRARVGLLPRRRALDETPEPRWTVLA
ncbi:MAG: hypothetical protein R3F61_17825 [Myxococcota bacterium]